MKYLPCVVPMTALLLGACATTPPAPEVDANGKKIEYVYYTPVGTNIPVKIRKDQLHSTDQESAADQKMLRDFMEKGRKQPSGN